MLITVRFEQYLRQPARCRGGQPEPKPWDRQAGAQSTGRSRWPPSSYLRGAKAADHLGRPVSFGWRGRPGGRDRWGRPVGHPKPTGTRCSSPGARPGRPSSRLAAADRRPGAGLPATSGQHPRRGGGTAWAERERRGPGRWLGRAQLLQGPRCLRGRVTRRDGPPGLGIPGLALYLAKVMTQVNENGSSSIADQDRRGPGNRATDLGQPPRAPAAGRSGSPGA